MVVTDVMSEKDQERNSLLDRRCSTTQTSSSRRRRARAYQPARCASRPSRRGARPTRVPLTPPAAARPLPPGLTQRLRLPPRRCATAGARRAPGRARGRSGAPAGTSTRQWTSRLSVRPGVAGGDAAPLSVAPPVEFHAQCVPSSRPTDRGSARRSARRPRSAARAPRQVARRAGRRRRQRHPDGPVFRERGRVMPRVCHEPGGEESAYHDLQRAARLHGQHLPLAPRPGRVAPQGCARPGSHAAVRVDSPASALAEHAELAAGPSPFDSAHRRDSAGYELGALRSREGGRSRLPNASILILAMDWDSPRPCWRAAARRRFAPQAFGSAPDRALQPLNDSPGRAAESPWRRARSFEEVLDLVEDAGDRRLGTL